MGDPFMVGFEMKGQSYSLGLRLPGQSYGQTCQALEPTSQQGVSLARPFPFPQGSWQPPYLPSTDHFLSSIDCLAASGAALGATDLLGKLGRVGVGGGPVARGPAWGGTGSESGYNPDSISPSHPKGQGQQGL